MFLSKIIIKKQKIGSFPDLRRSVLRSFLDECSRCNFIFPSFLFVLTHLATAENENAATDGDASSQGEIIAATAAACSPAPTAKEQLLQAKAQVAELRADIRIKDAALEAKVAVHKAEVALLETKLQSKEAALAAALQSKEAVPAVPHAR